MTQQKRNLYKLLSKAIRIASEAHEKVLDKGGKPYILHPLRLMFSLPQHDPELLMIAALHDVIEDTHWSIDMLKQEGFTKRVTDALELLTHDDDTPYFEYIKTMFDNYDCILVKMADLEDNSDITRLKGISEKDIARIQKYHHSYIMLKEAKQKFI